MTKTARRLGVLTGLALLCWVLVAPAHAQRVKDLTTLLGVRNNQLVGYGLVVGLDGTGDQTTQTPFTTQTLQNMLNSLGIQLPPGVSAKTLQLRNVAAVMVTATLPPFARQGQSLDVTVGSMGNARSLRGGSLLLTPLKGADGKVYANAQGNLLVAGAGASAGGSSVRDPAMPAWTTKSGCRSSMARAVWSAASTGPIPQHNVSRPSRSASSRSVAATTSMSRG